MEKRSLSSRRMRAVQSFGVVAALIAFAGCTTVNPYTREEQTSKAAKGAGIGAVHVWAQRVDVPFTEPEFLGAGELNGARPDVAMTYGKQFDRTGWALSVPGLAPGTYDITAYVWRTSTQRFEDARSVRITVR